MDKHSIPHDLPVEKAKQVIEKAAEEYCRKFKAYSPKTSWSSDNKMAIKASAFGFPIIAELTLKEESIDIAMAIPLAFKSFKGVAIKMIDQEVNRWIEEAKSSTEMV